MEAQCRFCGETKDVEEFDKKLAEGPRELWNLRRCKACTRKAYLERYSDKERRDALKESSRNWKKANRGRHAENARAWRARNPDKVRAVNRLNYAIRKGRVERQPCQVCGAKSQAHHDSYAEGQELNVRWLCQKHHKLWHSVLDDVGSDVDLDDRFSAFVKSLSTTP